MSRRIAPTVAAGVLAAVYVIVSPPSLDLAAHLFRAHLFRTEGFAIWNNWWYAGHHVPGYSVLFPPAAAGLSPQLAAAIAATGSAALFEALAYRNFGRDGWLGALVFGVATASNLFTGRLPFAFGALPAVGAVLALDCGRAWLAVSLAVLSALASPVAALFVAVAGAAYAVGSRAWIRSAPAAYAVGSVGSRRTTSPPLPGAAVTVAALLPVGVLAIAFPEGGSEPFAFSTFWPLPLMAIGALGLLAHERRTLRAGVVLYTLGTIAAYLVSTPVGSNAARLGTFLAAPLAALLLWPRKLALLAVVALPLLYLEWHDPVRDLSTAVGDPSSSKGYYDPLLSFLARQPGPPFRVEVPFTQFHWEAYVLASRFPIPRGWERQLDIKYNHLFYGGPLTPATYDAWLHQLAVRFVAVSDAPLDYAGVAEKALIDRGLPYLYLVLRTRHWRVYAVDKPTPLVQGVATLRTFSAQSLTLAASRAGAALVRVRFTPFWALASGSGCVAPDDGFTRVIFKRAETARLLIRFSLSRIQSRSPRCN